jgi:uncharacterized membrane protein
MIHYLTLIISTLVVAGVTHLATILLIPHTATRDMYQRLGAFAFGDGIHILPAATPQQSPLPLMDPAIVIGVCRYDLTLQGAQQMRGQHPPWYWSITVHDNHGSAFFAINNRSLGERTIDLRVMSADNVQRLRADMPEDAEQDLLIPSPTLQGFILVRALAPTPSARASVEDSLKAINCQLIEALR